MFQPVNSRVEFPKQEEVTLQLWKEKSIFNKSVTARQGKPRFTLYEGPPTANARPGIHHIMPRVLKDIIPRFKTMKGYYAPRIGGWDTHGLPVELEIEKALGFSGKAQIEEYGIEKFNQKCRESVFNYIGDWEKMTERIGYWADLDNAYVTMKNEYIESVWWALKQMWDKEMIYQGYRVTPHCPRCETSLSSHEVAQGYKENTPDPSVFVKFKITGQKAGIPTDKPAYLLAWTTTPWTLPGNTALAVANNAEYAVIDSGDEYLVLAAARLEAVELNTAPVFHRLKGSELVGLPYLPLFNPHQFGLERRRFSKKGGLELQPADDNLNYKVITGDFVSMDDGTGIVHIAPAYGEADYQAGENNGLDFIHQVSLSGKMLGSFPGAGKFVKQADKEIIADLQERGLLYRSEIIKHTYPFCWRCSSPLLYYAKQSWYIRTTSAKDKLIAGNTQINWFPEHIKQGRFGDWLQNNVDWAFSRERYWGTPLPIWRCESCGAYDCAGGLDDLRSRPGFNGLREPLDLHRPFVDEITYTCSKCGGKMKREPEVIDCWFDSGAMPFAQSHYPFENKTLLEDGRFPADYICEAIDQTRGWFYSLHAISTLLFDRSAYKNVICHGHILDSKGEKMSKSKGNVADLWGSINKYGADALRWYIYTAAPLGNSMRFDEAAITEMSRGFMTTLWNVYSFFVMYANIDNFKPGARAATAVPAELDRWILSELNQLIIDVDNALESYDPRGGAWQIAAFVDNLSNWYVRRSRRRFWKSEDDTDKLSAYNALYECLTTLAKLMAPFTPFLAEELYQNLVLSVAPDAPESVHLTDFPQADKSKINTELAEANRLAMKLSSLGRAVRSKAGAKVRQPLQTAYFSSSFGRTLGSEEIRQMVLDELNIKEVKFESPDRLRAIAQKEGHFADDKESPSVVLDTRITPELEAEGVAREIVHRIQGMRRAAGYEIADHINICFQGDDYIRSIMQTGETAGYISQETLADSLSEAETEDADAKESFKLGGHEVTLTIKKSAQA